MIEKLLELLTGVDNKTLEPAYVWWAMTISIALGLEVYSVVWKVPFDIQAYGVGIGALMIGAGWSKKVGA
jgi:hypothetical protein